MDAPTEDEWVEGQIQLRTGEHEGVYSDWRIYMVVDRVRADNQVFVAVDDFAFR